jgi:structural maintenance of chromosome 4
LIQDERSRSEASRTFESSVTKIEKEKSKVEEYEASLTKEEKVLEEIRDSLKGTIVDFHVVFVLLTLVHRQDTGFS